MFKYVVKRILLMLLTFFIIMTLCFILVKMLPLTNLPQDPALRDIILARRELMGYNKPILVQYGIFLQRVILHWDWGIGETMYSGREVVDIFAEKLPPTILINTYSLLFSVPIGIALGIFAALKKNKWQDHVVSTGVMILVSVPSFVYAFLVQYVLSFELNLFPFQINSGTAWLSPSMFFSMIPAILSLSFGVIAGLTRFTRAELTEVLTGEYMLLARAKGLTKGQATVRHALRNAMVPILPMIIGQFISILGGSLVIEQIFGIPGVGPLYIQAINVRDYNFFMMLSAFYTFIGLAATILVDISYGFIDPRIRMGSRK
ncbi:MAG: ABC transporter permease [Clostridia bacterium]|nr:ABC transporter permease [Clostridia bacterium]